MSLFDVVLGKPLATSAEHDEHIGVAAGIPIFGLDGLTSAAYGPEAAMALLMPLGLAGVDNYLLPIFGCILTLLTILYFSYRQTIVAYPNGGGSFTVASENLGDGAGLLAAAALMIDYILTAAVGVSAGVTALISAVPSLHAYQLSLCLLILAVIVAILLTRTVVRPLASVAKAANRLAAGDLRARAPVDGPREIRQVGSAQRGEAARCRQPVAVQRCRNGEGGDGRVVHRAQRL